MNNKTTESLKAATANPADFPLGSPESRAAARALLTAKTSLSSDDQDCLNVIHVCISAPGVSRDIESTEAYRRGWELSQARNPIIPSHLDPRYGKDNFASMEFERIHDRLPKEGEVLRYSDLVEAFSDRVYDALYNWFLRASWERKVPQIPYPLKWENQLLYQRICDYATKEWRWEKQPRQDAPAYRWQSIEYDVITDAGLPLRGGIDVALMPITPAVVFSLDADGKYRVSPYVEKPN